MTLKAICLGNFRARRLVGDEDALGLVVELVDAFLAGARDRLVGRDDDALDRRLVVERLQGHHHLRGRAVGVGDDAALAVRGEEGLEDVAVDLGHDERNVLVVAPVARIIDDDGAGGGDLRRPLLGGARARAHHGEIDAAEIEVLEVLALQHLVAEAQLAPDRARGGQRNDLAHRKLAFGEDVEHLTADIARGPDDGDSVTHLEIQSFQLPRGIYRGQPVAASPRREWPGERLNRFWWFCCLERRADEAVDAERPLIRSVRDRRKRTCSGTRCSAPLS